MILDGFNKNGVKAPSIGMTQDPQDHGATWRDQIFKAMFWGSPLNRRPIDYISFLVPTVQGIYTPINGLHPIPEPLGTIA